MLKCLRHGKAPATVSMNTGRFTILFLFTHRCSRQGSSGKTTCDCSRLSSSTKVLRLERPSRDLKSLHARLRKPPLAQLSPQPYPPFVLYSAKCILHNCIIHMCAIFLVYQYDGLSLNHWCHHNLLIRSANFTPLQHTDTNNFIRWRKIFILKVLAWRDLSVQLIQAFTASHFHLNQLHLPKYTYTQCHVRRMKLRHAIHLPVLQVVTDTSFRVYLTLNQRYAIVYYGLY